MLRYYQCDVGGYSLDVGGYPALEFIFDVSISHRDSELVTQDSLPPRMFTLDENRGRLRFCDALEPAFRVLEGQAAAAGLLP